VEALAELGHALGVERLAGEVLGNRSRTSTRGGILKAEAAIRYAEILATTGVHHIGDVTELRGDIARATAIERQLADVPGHGSGARLSYCGCSPATTTA
jgi:hypothetical protein